MAPGARDGVFLLLGYLMVLGCMDRMMVAEAQDPITCSLPSDSTISLNYCTYSDQSNTSNQTTDCQGYLTDVQDSPSKLCCTGVNNVAYYKTACICMATFYPPATVNATRQLQLPRLCNVTTDLCGQCPSFIVAKTTAVPVCKCTFTFANYSFFLWRCVQFDTIFSFPVDRPVWVGVMVGRSCLCRISPASSPFCFLKSATIFVPYIHYGQYDSSADLWVYLASANHPPWGFILLMVWGAFWSLLKFSSRSTSLSGCCSENIAVISNHPCSFTIIFLEPLRPSYATILGKEL